MTDIVASYIGRGLMGFIWVYLAYAICSNILNKITNKKLSLVVRMVFATIATGVILGPDIDPMLGWMQWAIDGILVYLFIALAKKDQWYYR